MPIRKKEGGKKGIKHLNTHYTRVAPSCHELMSYLSNHLKFHIKQPITCPKPGSEQEALSLLGTMWAVPQATAAPMASLPAFPWQLTAPVRSKAGVC